MEVSTTLGIAREVSATFTPSSITELEREFLALRHKYQSISVVSRGNNWGYGCRAPNRDGDLVIDLHQCQNISEFDAYQGTVTLEPGVTYGQLAQFLKDNGDKWIAPVHGGGANCSVVGNALERGYGITPYTDHFGAVLSLRAILNDGTIYESSLKSLGQKKLAKLFRNGVGPYFDGLFSQSGLGIVTEVTIRLAQKPKYAEMFYFNIKNESDLAAVVEAIKLCKRDLGSTLGGINLLNRERVLSMLVEYPLDKIKTGASLSQQEITDFSKNFQVSPWLVVGMIYGEKKMVKTAKNYIKENFKAISKRSFFFNTSNRMVLSIVQKVCDRLGMKSLSSTLASIAKAYNLLLGTPSDVALQLAYWKCEDRSLLASKDLNPQRDGCGLIWYAPLVEMKGEVVVNYVRFIRESAQKFDLNALITLTTIDDLCFDSTVPILFNQKNINEQIKVTQFYEYLLAEGAKKGFFPYRLNIATQERYKLQNPFFNFQSVNANRYR